METNLERFKDSYYATPKTLHDIFIDIQSPDLGEKRIKNPNSGDFLLAMRFLKKYPTKYDLSAISDTTEKTALLRVWKYVKAIQALKEEKVRFLPCCNDNSLFLNLIFWYPMVQIVWYFDEDNENPEFKDTYIVSVDGVHFRIWEPRKFPSTKWYSKKYNKAGLSYEIALSLKRNKIVWVNGPFPAGENDKAIFNKPEGLGTKLKPGQLAIGDEGYRGAPEKVSTCNSLNSQNTKEIKHRSKARQETVNSRLKGFGVLNQVFHCTGAT